MLPTSLLAQNAPTPPSIANDLAARRLPDVLLGANGQKITTEAQWRARRDEILEMFRSQVYGRASMGKPADLRFRVEKIDPLALGGAATLKQVAIEFSGLRRAGEANEPTGRISLVLFTPNRAPKPSPTFLLISHRGASNLDPTRAEKTEFWPAELLIARGYGAAAFLAADLDPDTADNFQNGVHGLFDAARKPDEARAGDAWGTLAAWSWGASRVMDYLQTDRDVDARRVAVVGHSRGGKAALWTGAQDERFALVVSNSSGSTGAALARGKSGESIADINTQFPHWFASNYRRYNRRESEQPLDQHFLIALMAPRPVYIASSSLDDWADPRSEFLAGVAASPVYELLGQAGLKPKSWPQVNEVLHDGHIGYHLREGKHDLNQVNWTHFLDFADKQWGVQR